MIAPILDGKENHPMPLRRAAAFALTITLVGALLGLSSGLFACGKKDTSAAAALVNGEQVSKKRFELAVDSMVKRVGGGMGLAANPDLAKDPELGKGVLDNLIAVELIYQEAKKAGYTASTEAIERAVKSFRDRSPSPEAFAEELKKRGVSEEMLRADVSRQIVLEAFVDRGLGIPAPSAEEVKKFYGENVGRLKQPEQVRASHILLKLAPDASAVEKEKALAKAKELSAKARAGADFAELARANSADGSAAMGGDLGLFTRGRMVPEFENAAFSLKPGQVSGPVLSQFGYHVIKVTERKAEGVPSLEELTPKIVEYLKGQKTQEVLEKKVEELKARADIKVLIDFSAPAAAGSTAAPAK
jgi:peptidyl-prolyl cis-trans isomerase C